MAGAVVAVAGPEQVGERRALMGLSFQRQVDEQRPHFVGLKPRKWFIGQCYRRIA